MTTEHVREVLLNLIAFILSVTVHEFGHAWVATRLGDSLPAREGRVTLNPRAHIDWIGTILMPLVIGMAPGARVPLLAWGRPVRTTLVHGGRSILVSLAGPVMNLILALFVSLLIVLLGRLSVLGREGAVVLLEHLVWLNISLFFFNLLPLPPLDGGQVLAQMLPSSLDGLRVVLLRWGGLILLGLLLVHGLDTLMIPAQRVGESWAVLVARLAFP